jgi:hypothetical protein
MDILKYDFGEVDSARFQSDERPCEIIFCILGIEIATWPKLLK